MDTSTYEILKECNSGCRMAVNSIEQLVVYLKNQELQELFSKYKEDYEKMERESIRLSEGKLQEEKFSEKAAETFARVEGILPAPESSHAIKVAIDEALKCKETGEEKNIVFGLTGTGYFDMVAYQKYNDGEMSDYIPTDEELEKSFATLPKVEL